MRRLLLLLVSLSVLSAALPARADEPVPPDPSPTTVLGEGAGWCWFSDPRSVHVALPTPRTFTGWIDASGAIVVSAYDHVTARTSYTTVMSSFFVDDHNNPSLLAHPDGRISVFWSGHNEDAIWMRTTARPGDLTSFGPTRAVRSFAPGDRVTTYTNPVMLPGEGGRIHLFFRSGYSHQAFVTSDDDGRTWSAATVLVENAHHRPYVKYDSDGDRTIATAYTDGHPDELRSSVYYAALREGRFSRADGTVVHDLAAGPLRPDQGDLLWDAAATGVSGWVHDVALDSEGRPVVVFATVPSRTDHRYHYARWDGARWQVRELGSAGGSISADGREPSYSGGITLDHEDPSVVYLARPGEDPLVDEIERWSTPDAGTTWVAEALTSGSTRTNVRPVSPRALPATAAMQAVWMQGEYPGFTRFRTSLLTTAPRSEQPRGATVVRASVSTVRAALGSTATVSARLVEASGRHVGGHEVVLEKRAPGLTSWRRVEEQRTDSDGLVRFAQRVERSLEHRVVWPGDEDHDRSVSPVLLVAARRGYTRLRASASGAPGRVVLDGRLSDEQGAPVAGRDVVLLGRRAGTPTWSTLATARTTALGLVRYRRLVVQPTEYALRFAGDARLAPTTTLPLLRR